VPNALFRDWLTKHYAAVLDEALAEVERKGTAIRFVSEPGESGDPAATVTTPPVESPSNLVEAAAEEESPPGGLAPRYSFDTFIVRSSNQFAPRACGAVRGA